MERRLIMIAEAAQSVMVRRNSGRIDNRLQRPQSDRPAVLRPARQYAHRAKPIADRA
jgi:hypothetical protein